MSDAIFPTPPGIKIEVKRTPIWNTLEQKAASGKVLTAALMTYPNRKYSLSFEFLRGGAYGELEQFEAFFNARKGRFDTFLFSDPDDYSVVNQQFGAGTGSQVAFFLSRSRGGYSEPVQALNGNPVIKVGGVTKTLTTDYTISATGAVTFVVAPTAGAELTWTGSYYWRCRFAQDVADFEKFMHNLWKLNRIEIVLDKR